MPPPPNQLYTAFSFVGLVLSVIPFYWHLEGTRSVSRDRSALPKQRTAQRGIQGLACICFGRVLGA
jgi:hypothetical protein